MAINTYAFEERFGFRSPFRIGISESAKDVVLDGRVENVMIEVLKGDIYMPAFSFKDFDYLSQSVENLDQRLNLTYF
jgi:hypothetical protein